MSDTPLQILGEDAAACEGEFCELPQHREHAIVSRRLDEDAV
jgi:hypothetical protein